MSELQKLRVLLADDYPGLHTALTRLLAPSCQIVGHVFDTVELFEITGHVRPDVLLLDFSIPGLNALEVCRRFIQNKSQVKVIILTAVDDLDVRDQCLAAGASAFVDKMRLTTDLLPAIEGAAAEITRVRGIRPI